MFAKKAWIACACAGLIVGGSVMAQDAKKPVLDTLDQKASYAIGLNMGTNMEKNGIDLALDQFLQGLKDGMAKADPAMTPDEIQATMIEFQQVMQQKAMEKAAVDGAANKAEGEAFLAENGKRDGVITLDSGIQYEVLKKGDGPIATATDGAVVHYTGKLIDDTVFDSSEDRGPFEVNPVVGPPGQSVIEGWQQILQLMPQGSKWRVYIPSDLAYGPDGTGPGGPIGPNAALIFDIEIIEVAKN